jgi:hypothetical protein
MRWRRAKSSRSKSPFNVEHEREGDEEEIEFQIRWTNF